MAMGLPPLDPLLHYSLRLQPQLLRRIVCSMHVLRLTASFAAGPKLTSCASVVWNSNRRIETAGTKITGDGACMYSAYAFMVKLHRIVVHTICNPLRLLALADPAGSRESQYSSSV